MPQSILVIEDDAAIRRGICDTLRHVGYQVFDCGDGKQGLEMAMSYDYDLLLLDLVLPHRSGLDILDEVRRSRPNVPSIILSAKGEMNDRVRGLRAGADDYVVKPFGIDELLARIEAVLRRSPGRVESSLTLMMPACQADLGRAEVLVAGKVHETLTERECEVLHYFAVHRDHVLAREELLANVWHIDPRGSNTRVVDMTISRLREKLIDGDMVLETVHGQGYRLNSLVTVESISRLEQ
jgi:DNA-binding response OmpR family regulator